MEVFRLSEVLNREYPLATIPWTSSHASNTGIGFYNFPEVIFNQTFIAEKIRNFRNFKAGVRVSIRMSSTQFNYGRIMCAYIPDVVDDPYYDDRTATLEILSGFPHVIVSASSSEIAVLDIPFIHFNRAIDVTSTDSGKRMGQIRFKVLNPLTNINGVATTADIFVTAQFINTELYVPYTPTSNKRRDPHYHTKESVAKSKEGIISGALQSAADTAAKIEKAPFIDKLSSLYKVGSSVASAMSIIGLDKPTTLQRTAVDKINPYSDIANARGIDTSVKLGIDPENGISTIPNVGGVSHDEMDLNYIAGTPMLFKIMTFGNTDPIGTVKTIVENNLHNLAPTYASFLVDLSYCYSGGIKVKLYISASNMHAARIVLFLNNQPTNWQTCYHRVFDVQGDTEIEVTLPYTSVELAHPGDNSPQTFYAELLSYSQSQETINTPIYMNVYVSAASDFKIYGPVDRLVALESNPRLDFGKEFQPLHPSMTGFDHHGFIFGEEIKSYRDFIHRYVPIKRVGTSPVSIYEGTGNIGPGGFTGLELYGQIFRFHRGSIRFKLIQNDDSKRAVAFGRPSDSPNYYLGNTLSTGVNPLLEFEVPYYEYRLFKETFRNHELCFTATGPAVDDETYMLKAAGEDFSFHFLQPPLIYLFPMAANYGVTGLMTYLSGSS
nr:MAG: capsid protein [Jingmen bat picorna-like virus 3]